MSVMNSLKTKTKLKQKERKSRCSSVNKTSGDSTHAGGDTFHAAPAPPFCFSILTSNKAFCYFSWTWSNVLPNPHTSPTSCVTIPEADVEESAWNIPPQKHQTPASRASWPSHRAFCCLSWRTLRTETTEEQLVQVTVSPLTGLKDGLSGSLPC